ncbi:Extracellular globin-4 [Lamellibrachia satsuma]|nr:Extracellular globin-4 [Lamellibrachia satsuma]
MRFPEEARSFTHTHSLKMHCLTFLLVVCGATATLVRGWCSHDDVDIVLAAWNQAMGIGGNGDKRIVIKKATEFFVRLVDEFPDIKPLLAKVNIDDTMSPEFGAHALRVATGLDLCINALHDTPVLEKVTSHLAVQHEGRVGVTKKYFDGMRKFIDRNMPMLVDNLDFDAWNNCLTPIFNAITARLL